MSLATTPKHPTRDAQTVSFFTHAKSLGTWGLALSFAATWFGATSTKAIMDTYWHDGISGLWMIAIPSMLTMILVSFLIAKRVQRLPYMTQPEAIEHAFGRRGRLFLAVVILLGSTTTLSSQLVAARQLLQGLLGESGDLALLVIYGIVLAYSMFGGFFAVVLTDMLQCGLMLLALGSLAGFSLWHFLQAPEVFQHSWQFPPHLPAQTFWQLLPKPDYALALTAVFALAWSIAPEMWQRMKACSTAKQAQRVGFIAFLLILTLCAIVFWIGISAQGVLDVLHLAPTGKPNVFLWLTQALPFLWWQALLLLGFLSAVTSTMDSCLSVSSQSFVVDLIQRFVLPHAKWHSLRWFNYAFLILQGVLSVLIAFRFNDIIKVLWLSADIYACTMLIPVLAIFFHARPHRLAGQWAMWIGGFCVALTTLKQYTTLPLHALPDWPFSTLYGILLAGFTYLIIQALNPQFVPKEIHPCPS